MPEVKGALGQLYLDGALVPKDEQKGLLSLWARWDYDARLRLMAALAAHPDLTITYPGGILYDATEAVALDEPQALNALIDLKLSQSAQFHDEAGGFRLAKR